MSTPTIIPETESTKKSTRLVVTASNKKTIGPSAMKEQMEARAARFGATTIKDSSEPDKLAARAKRFAELNKGQTPVAGAVTNSPMDDDKLAKRAARFANINIAGKPAAATTQTSATTTSTAPKALDNEALAKRAERFASLGTK